MFYIIHILYLNNLRILKFTIKDCCTKVELFIFYNNIIPQPSLFYFKILVTTVFWQFRQSCLSYKMVKLMLIKQSAIFSKTWVQWHTVKSPMPKDRFLEDRSYTKRISHSSVNLYQIITQGFSKIFYKTPGTNW